MTDTNEGTNTIHDIKTTTLISHSTDTSVDNKESIHLDTTTWKTDEDGFHPPSYLLPLSSTSFDSWLVPKLKHEWSSCDLGTLLTKEKVAEAQLGFGHLETHYKTRLLLAFISMRWGDQEESKENIQSILQLAEKDSDEWVQVIAGIVQQYVLKGDKKPIITDFLKETLDSTSTLILDRLNDTSKKPPKVVVDDFFCPENAYLDVSLRPSLAINPVQHFTRRQKVNGGGSLQAGSALKKSSKTNGNIIPSDDRLAKKLPLPTTRPQLPRPQLASSSLNASSLNRPGSKVQLPAAKTLKEEIRRKADAGRFKRQRSRISVIDLDEVKAIESEKAQKAEERKRKKSKSVSTPTNASTDGNSHEQVDNTSSAVSDAALEGNIENDLPEVNSSENTPLTTNDTNLGSSGAVPQNMSNNDIAHGIEHSALTYSSGPHSPAMADGAHALLSAAFQMNDMPQNGLSEYGSQNMQSIHGPGIPFEPEHVNGLNTMSALASSSYVQPPYQSYGNNQGMFPAYDNLQRDPDHVEGDFIHHTYQNNSLPQTMQSSIHNNHYNRNHFHSNHNN